MTTSISSKAFCSITDRQTDKIFTEQMLIYEGNLHKKNGAISQLGAEKITFPPKPDRQTDIHTYRQTDGYLLLQSSFATKNLLVTKQLPCRIINNPIFFQNLLCIFYKKCRLCNLFLKLNQFFTQVNKHLFPLKLDL